MTAKLLALSAFIFLASYVLPTALHSAAFADQYAHAREASPINPTSLRERNTDLSDIISRAEAKEGLSSFGDTLLRSQNAFAQTEIFAIEHS